MAPNPVFLLLPCQTGTQSARIQRWLLYPCDRLKNQNMYISISIWSVAFRVLNFIMHFSIVIPLSSKSSHYWEGFISPHLNSPNIKNPIIMGYAMFVVSTI